MKKQLRLGIEGHNCDSGGDYMGLQRDTYHSGNWTNGEGYRDGTAGAAINNVMRTQKRPTSNDRHRTVDGTRLVSVTPPKLKASGPKPKTEGDQLLKAARTIFTIFQQVAQLQGFSVEEICLKDKATQQSWTKEQLMAPSPKK